MIKKLKEISIYYKHTLVNLVFLLGLILSAIGSWQVYFPKMGLTPKLFSMIPYSIIKLFAFAPTEGLWGELPLAYLLAAWICPLGTVIGFFSFFNRIWDRIKLIFTPKRKDTYLILGFNEKSRFFISHLKKSKANPFIYVILPLKEEARYKNETTSLGIDTIPLIYEDALHLSNIKFIESLYHDGIKAIVSFEDEPLCYGHLSIISKLFANSKRGNRTYDVWVSTENDELKDIIKKEMDLLTNFSMHYFNTNELAAVKLISGSRFKLHRTDRWDEKWSIEDISSEQSISDKIGRPHLLLIGFSGLGQQILNMAVNQGNINLFKKMKVTILDRNADSLLSQYEGFIPQIHHVLDIELISKGLTSKETRERLREISGKEPITSVVYTIEDTQGSLLSLERYSEYFRDIPVAIYCDNVSVFEPLLTPLLRKYSMLTVFGNMKDILSPENIFNEEVYKSTKKFNGEYAAYSAFLMGWDPPKETLEKQWEKLNSLHKESSFYQTMHRYVKVDLLKRIAEAKGNKQSISEMISDWKKLMENKSNEEKVAAIESDPVLNYLTSIEHKRWNSFYYRKDFKYSDAKNEVLKLHNCLIDDWDIFLKTRRDYVIYDFLSTLVIGESDLKEN